MSSSNINLTEEEAIQLLELRAEELMRNNPNWQYISVVELMNDRGFGFKIGVYDFNLEKGQLDSGLPQRKSVDMREGHIQFEMPIYQGASQDRLRTETIGVSYPEIDVVVLLTGVSFKDSIEDQSTEWIDPLAEDNDQRLMGHLLNSGHSRSGGGALGGILLDKSGKKFAVTAYHVVERRGDFITGPIMVYSPDSPFPDQRRKLGEVFWYKDIPELDIALITLEDPGYVSAGSICSRIDPQPYLGPLPTRGEKVKICSSSSLTSGQVLDAEVESCFSVVRQNINGNNIAIGRIQTTDLGDGGDSGSLVLNERNEVVGMLSWDVGTFQSYFMPLEILKTPIHGTIDGIAYRFNFDKILT